MRLSFFLYYQISKLMQKPPSIRTIDDIWHWDWTIHEQIAYKPMPSFHQYTPNRPKYASAFSSFPRRRDSVYTYTASSNAILICSTIDCLACAVLAYPCPRLFECINFPVFNIVTSRAPVMPTSLCSFTSMRSRNSCLRKSLSAR